MVRIPRPPRRLHFHRRCGHSWFQAVGPSSECSIHAPFEAGCLGSGALNHTPPDGRHLRKPFASCETRSPRFSALLLPSLSVLLLDLREFPDNQGNHRSEEAEKSTHLCGILHRTRIEGDRGDEQRDRETDRGHATDHE